MHLFLEFLLVHILVKNNIFAFKLIRKGNLPLVDRTFKEKLKDVGKLDPLSNEAYVLIA